MQRRASILGAAAICLLFLGLAGAGILSFHLYRLRRSRPALYGLAEVLVATVVWWAALIEAADVREGATVVVATIAGSVYVLVDGFKNGADGFRPVLERVQDRIDDL